MVAALIDYSQLIGNANGTTPEVEATSKALRVTPKPQELGSLGGGAYGIASLPNLNQSTLGAVTLTNANVYSFRWSGKQSIARVRKVTLSFGWGVAGTAGVFTFNMKIARRFLAQYNLGTTDYGPISGGVMSPLRSSHSQPTTEVNVVQTTTSTTSNLFSEIVYLNLVGVGGNDSGALGLSGGASVVTLDTNPIASISVSRPATAGTTALKPLAIWDTAEGDAPLELSAQEGFAIQVTAPALGTSPSLIGLSIVTLFDEIPLTLI